MFVQWNLLKTFSEANIIFWCTWSVFWHEYTGRLQNKSGFILTNLCLKQASLLAKLMYRQM